MRDDEAQTPFSLPLEQLAACYGLTDFQLTAYSDYKSIRLFWLELNQSYKGGELSLDWEAHRLIREQFYERRSGLLWILCAVQENAVKAIFPMVKEDDSAPWSLCDEFIIGREYFCPPDLIHRFAGLLSTIQQEDMSSFYIPLKVEDFVREPSAVIDLGNSAAVYQSGLDQRVQKELRRIRRINEDLRVECDLQVHYDLIANVLHSQLDYWLRKKGAASEDEYSYSRDKIHTDLRLMERAAELGKLMALYIYEGDLLIAANFSVRRGQSGVDDYLCLRDCSEKMKRRSLGVFAIIGNMDYCRQNGIRYYDLSACMAPYKEMLINTRMSHYHLYRPTKV